MTLQSIDLFAGGGGLSEGMRQAGFNILSAVELESAAAQTFQRNHPEAIVIERDIRHLSSVEILKQCNIKLGDLDLLAGCPPCQGFSSLTSKYKRADERNGLINEVSRLVKELMPRAIMIENVPGLADKGKHHLEEFVSFIEQLGYSVTHDVLQVADYGVPQNRRRFVLLAGFGFSIEIPKPTHSRTGERGLPKWKTVREALQGLGAPVPLSRSSDFGGPRRLNWHVTRTLSDLNLERLRHLKAGGNRFDIPDGIRPACHKGVNKGFGNVYARMTWDEASPTITGGCTTLSKGRFGHPDELRTISVREAARLQTFPDTYEFATEFVDTACQIIGNALPCEFARIMSQECHRKLLHDQRNRTIRKRPDGLWENKRNGVKRATSLHLSKHEATHAATSLLRRQGGSTLRLVDEARVTLHAGFCDGADVCFEAC